MMPCELQCTRSFDPRSRTGSDTWRQARPRRICGFDPRSRTGSDDRCRRQWRQASGFDPRSRTGSDIHAPTTDRLEAVFRSTLPHGERRVSRISF